jgi:hypothetical protein
LPGLGHGPLAHDLAGKQKIRTHGSHVFTGNAKHQSMAVHAGIHVFAVSAGRIFQHGQVAFRDIHHQQRNAAGLGGPARLFRGKKRRFK